MLHLGSSNKVKVLITDEAFAWHTQTAYAYGYIRTQIRARGLGFWFDELSTLTYHDKRPDSMLDTDQWYAGLDYAKSRLVALAPDTLSRFTKIAQLYHILPYRSQRPIVNGLRTHVNPDAPTTPAALASAVLEAIGLRWLSPTFIPRASDQYAEPLRKVRRPVFAYQYPGEDT